MIPNNFSYYRPESAEKAAEIYEQLIQEGLTPLYYAGGTEVVTYARKQIISPDAVIDIKDIPLCQEHGEKDGELVFGAALNLSEIAEKNHYPLLAQTVSKIADRTVRNQLTLGGNICGRLPYREGLLPFLVADTRVVTMSVETKELQEKPITEVFERRMKLSKGEFIVQFKTNSEAALKRFATIRKVKQGEVAYPMLLVVALESLIEDEADKMHWAFSNVCPFPFSSAEVDEFIHQLVGDKSSVGIEDLDTLKEYLPTKLANDLQAGPDYREFNLKVAVRDALEVIKGGAS